jgi:hypothetical protein
MIRLQFVMGSGLPSEAIAWFSAGELSHVDAIMSDGSLLGARSDAIGGQLPGVRIRPAFYEKWARRVVMEIPATDSETTVFYDFIMKQVGKPYDKTAIFGFVADRNWREDDSWFCSELQSAGLEQAGVVPPLFLAANKITPAALALLASAINGKVTTDER